MGIFDFIDNEQGQSQSTEAATVQDDNNIPPVTKEPDQLPATEKKRKEKPVELAFLEPCTVCGGKDFAMNAARKLVCSTCFPSGSGQPVRSAPEKRPVDVLEEEKIDLLEPDPEGAAAAQREQCFQSALPWIEKNLPELLKTGWTREELFGKCHQAWPYGGWGVAWLPIWRKEDLKVSINQTTSAICFLFKGTDGRPVTQTAHPKKNKKSREK